RAFRRQPPVYSPLSARALFRAACLLLSQDDHRPRLQQFLADAYSASHVALTASGTQALELALRAGRWRAGSEAWSIVALPAFACFDVATAAVGSGLSIALYDVDPNTLSPDLDSLRATLASGVRVVVAAHLYGYPVDWQALQECVSPFGAVLIEDAA